MSAFIKRGDSYDCSALKQYGLKCSSIAACHSCKRLLAAPPEEGGSRPDYHRNLLNDLFEMMRSLDEVHAETLLKMIRGNTTFEQIQSYMDQALSSMLVHCTDEDTHRNLRNVRHRMEAYSRVPSFRPNIVDVHYLGGIVPYKASAKPWTTVTDDDALVSHLVSLYFTWDYPFYAFVDRDVLSRHILIGNVNSDFCSPFLVNALLANACHYAQYSEAYSLPGDIKVMGTEFLAEAEQYLQTHQFETGSGMRLASLQATLLLYERYSMSGNSDHGYFMLHRAVEMAEALGLINSPRLNINQSNMSSDMISSIKRTAWGLFQIDTVVHANFLRPCRVLEVSVEQIDRDETDEMDLWVAYPINKEARRSWMSQYFDEACRLSTIARDISRIFLPDQDPGFDIYEHKRVLYEKLRQWDQELPKCFSPAERPAAHIILLRLRYHALLINLFFDCFGGNPPFYAPQQQEAQQQFGSTIYDGTLDTALASAREISALVRLHRDQYGLVRAHQYIMYTITLALFTMLEQKSFDVLDYEFLSLTNSFSTVASCSQLGKDIFRIFCQSVRIRCQEEQDLDMETGEMERPPYGPSSVAVTPDRWNDYAEGLRKLADHDGGEEGSSHYTASGIEEMLSMYETMSLGKEGNLQFRQQSSSFRFSPSPE